MNPRILGAVVVIVAALAGLMYAAVNSTAASVVTVQQLLEGRVARQSVQLGARVADEQIVATTDPKFELRFRVRDILPGERQDDQEGKEPAQERQRHRRDMAGRKLADHGVAGPARRGDGEQQIRLVGDPAF